MIWFDGSIKKAVDKVKSSGALLLVFVEGDDSLSKKYEIYLNQESKFQVDDYVAIKIPHDSVAFQQFKQIYFSVPVPSVFFIQNNGIPLKVISSKDTSDIQDGINDVINKLRLKREKKNSVSPKIEPPPQVECESSHKKELKSLQHIKNTGRRIFDISEEEIQRRLKEIRAFPRFWLMQPDNSTTTKPSLPESARIQFRLPNNKMPSWEFPDLATLADVKAYLMEKTKLGSKIRLLRTYPRCSFGPEDERKTLKELSLTPSATLIVIPVEDKTVQAKVKSLIVRQSFLSTVLNTIFWPWFTLLNYFKKHVFKIATEEKEGPRRLPSDTAVEKTFNKKTSTSNIHGFKFDEDTDTDTEHPDNGNSTQQKFQK